MARASNVVSCSMSSCDDAAMAIIHSERDHKIGYLLKNHEKPKNIYRHEASFLTNNYSKKNAIDFFKSRKDLIKKHFEQPKKCERSLKNGSISTYLKTTKLDKNVDLYKEMTINFSEDQFKKCKIEDIELFIKNFADDFEKKTGCKVFMTSLHLDEGAIDKISNKINYNYHAHLLIENYSFEEKKTKLRNLDYRKLQTFAAYHFEKLGFRRGQKDSKKVHLDTKQFRQHAEIVNTLEKKMHDQTQSINEFFDLKYEISPNLPFFDASVISETFKNKNETNEKLKKQLKKEREKVIKLEKDLSEKNILIAKYKQDKFKLEQEYKQNYQALKDSHEAVQSDYMQLKVEKNEQINALKEQFESKLKILANLKNAEDFDFSFRRS